MSNMPSLVTVLRDRDIALVWTAGLISSVGTGAMFVALPYYTYRLTGSVTATAVVTLAEYAPTVGIGQLAGILVDRWDPRKVLIWANLGLGICTLGYLSVHLWWWFAVIAFLRSCLAQPVSPATHTLIPAITPPSALTAVNGVNAVGANIARLAGPGLGGILLHNGGLDTVVITDAVTFHTAAALTTAIRTTRHPPEPANPDRPTNPDDHDQAGSGVRPATAGPSQPIGLVQAWREGWTAVRRQPVLRALVPIMAIIGFGEGFVSALIAPWMATVVGGSSTDLGLMLSLQALGGIGGGLVVIRTAHRRRPLSQLAVGALAGGILLLAIFNYPLLRPTGPAGTSVLSGPWPAIILTVVAGFPFAVYGTAQAVAVQTCSSDGFRGRMASLTYGIQGISQLVGIATAGPAARLLELLGPTESLGPYAINADTLAYLTAGVLAFRLWRRTPSQPGDRLKNATDNPPI